MTPRSPPPAQEILPLQQQKQQQRPSPAPPPPPPPNTFASSEPPRYRRLEITDKDGNPIDIPPPPPRPPAVQRVLGPPPRPPRTAKPLTKLLRKQQKEQRKQQKHQDKLNQQQQLPKRQQMKQQQQQQEEEKAKEIEEKQRRQQQQQQLLQVAPNNDLSSTNINANSNSNSNSHPAAMDQVSVLADAFVPFTLRAVHLQPVTLPLRADSLPSLTKLLTTTLYDSLVPPIPQCHCSPSTHTDNHVITPPPVVHVAPELTYALSSSTSSSSAAALYPHHQGTTGQPSATAVATSTLITRHVDSVSDKTDYVEIFDSLLLLERQEILKLYERYSQYNISIQATPSSSLINLSSEASGGSGGDAAPIPPAITTLSTAIMSVKGLVDAQPALKVGDIVLLRPLHPIHFPTPYPPQHHYHHQTADWTSHAQQPYPPPPPLNPPPSLPPPTSGAWKQHHIPPPTPQQQQQHHNGAWHSHTQHPRNGAWNPYAEPPPQYQQPPATVEIYASIRQLVRGTPPVVAPLSSAVTTGDAPSTAKSTSTTKPHKAMDKIITTWLNAQQHHMLQTFYGKQHFHVRFVPSTRFYERCKTAVQWIGNLPPTMFTELLFPNRAPSILQTRQEEDHMILSSAHELEQHQLNDRQASFVYMVLKRTLHPSMDIVRPPMVLTGPAGTGKTKTLLAAISQVLQLNHPTSRQHASSVSSYSYSLPKKRPRYRILVCTPSHTAADVVTMRLAEQLDPSQLFRLYDSDRPVETVPIQMLRFACQSVETGAFSVPSGPQLLQYSVIVCTCSDAHLLYQAGCTNELLRMRRRCFEQYLQVAVRQCQLVDVDENGLEPAVQLPGVDQPHFTHLFVDEAAQATEPEILIPFSVVIDPLLGASKVEIGLVGDPRQLSPNVFSSEAARAGFGRSLLERLLLRPVHCLGGGGPHMLGNEPRLLEDYILYSLHDQLSVFLTLNYRGHPAFLMMPSALFYFDRLQSDKGVDSSSYWCDVLRHVEELSSPVDIKGLPDELRMHKKQWQWPVHFRGVTGQDVSVTIDSSFVGTNSWSNPAEARVVVDIVTTLTQQGVSSESIGVMAPFRGQVVTIRKLLRQINLGRINVGTIEDFQAVERDVMIVSLTRSSHSFVEHDIGQRMGIFGHSKRSNVALTRAEHLFCVVGNPHIMLKYQTWKQWLLFCLRNGFWYGEAVTRDELENEVTDMKGLTLEGTHPTLPELRQDVVISAMESICRQVE